VSLFVLSPEIEDRDEVEVATGRLKCKQKMYYIFVPKHASVLSYKVANCY
jgi:hypothetical protein